MATKRCFKCLCELPLSDFYRHTEMRDGHLNKCKTCTKKDVTEHRQTNIDSVREYDKLRSRLPHRVALQKDVRRKWRADHPDRQSAHSKTLYAIKTGALVRWPVCELPDCSDPPEAHHPHYGSPLLVVWLCHKHHAQAHALLKRSKR
jgi:hypothetical protein